MNTLQWEDNNMCVSVCVCPSACPFGVGLGCEWLWEPVREIYLQLLMHIV